MDNKKDDIIYDGHKGSPEHTCCLCECPKNYHIVYWKCLIFETELICGECCRIGCLKNDIDEQFSKKLGRKITIDEVNDACFECGKNFGIQDEQLSGDLENGKVEGDNYGEESNNEEKTKTIEEKKD